MKWQGRRASGNVRRSGGMGGAMIPMGGGGLILILILTFLFGGNPADVISQMPAQVQVEQNTEVNAELEDFLSVVLADTEDVWHEIFNQHDMAYAEPTLHLYSGAVRTACGTGDSRMGPFYCPGDDTIYIDVSFYNDLKNKYQASGDFAFAYVLAHEVGHHVQKQLGILDQVYSLQGRISQEEFNRYSVMMELQADYFAGVFAHYVQEKGYLEHGDIQEAMNAAAGVGDDRIQEQQMGRAKPDTFTHGTSAQRMEWFERGYQYGDLAHGDTFEALAA